MTLDPIPGLLRDLNAALRDRQRQTVNTIAKQLIDRGAAIGRQWQLISQVLLQNGECSLANDAMRLFAEAEGASPQDRFLQAATLAKTGRLLDAERILNAVGSDIPSPIENAFLRGTIATNRGRLEEARGHFHRAVGANPGSGQSWLSLSALGMARDAAYAEKLLAVQPLFSRAPSIERATYHYARGAVLHERGEYDVAFQAFAAGASAARETRSYDHNNDAAHAQRAVTGFDPAFIEGVAAALAEPRSRAIFVTGLPRSGTTLVEQILASHSAVDGGEELGLFRILDQEVGGHGRKALDDYFDRGGSAQALADLYSHLLQERYPGTGRVVDKTLNASRNLGLIMAIMPEAPIIWVRRDPADCAWSCFRTYFARGMSWSFQVENIARHFQLEDKLFDHWTAMFPGRILTVDYRELVTSPERIIRAIAAHCELPWEPQMLTPDKADRHVVTASVAQVRKPIGKMGLGVAEPYRRWFPPNAVSDVPGVKRAEF